MTQRWVRVSALHTLCGVVLLAGCSSAAPVIPPSESPLPVPTSAVPSPVSSAPAISTSPSPSVTWNEDQSDAADTVLRYFVLLNDLSKDPELAVDPLTGIAVEYIRDADVAMITDDREAGVTQVGDNLYYIKDVGPSIVNQDGRAVSVKACTDSSETDLVDQSGESVLTSDRAYFVYWKIEVEKVKTNWMIVDISNRVMPSCEL